MSKFFGLLIFILSLQSSYAHNSRVAIFDIYEKDGVNYLDIQLHREDLLNALALKYGNFNGNNLKNLAEEYMSDCITLNFNQHPAAIKFIKFEENENSFAISTLLSTPVKTVTQLDIENRCLLEIQPEQNNTTRIFLNKKYKILNLNSNNSTGKILYKIAN